MQRVTCMAFAFHQTYTLMNPTESLLEIFHQAIADYHKTDSVDQVISNPFDKAQTEHLYYRKNWIDNVQWHLEDIIRKPNIDPAEALVIKRRIDCLNDERTRTVELIDQRFLQRFKDVVPLPEAQLNTESPAWAIDRLSILALKIHHMHEQCIRPDASADHLTNCQAKLDILREQQADLCEAIEQLLSDLATGRKRMKVYHQMKMYNDPNLNPVLYTKKK